MSLAMSLIVPGGLSFSPERAASFAGEVDELFVFLTLFSFLLSLSIALLIVYFVSCYHRRRRRPGRVLRAGLRSLDLPWIAVPAVPAVLSLFIFFRGAGLYIRMTTPPAPAAQIHAVAPPWLWKLHHPEKSLAIDKPTREPTREPAWEPAWQALRRRFGVLATEALARIRLPIAVSIPIPPDDSKSRGAPAFSRTMSRIWIGAAAALPRTWPSRP
jgi:heme/copper-type cytochrome/quinol oxidase subunit 2